MVRGVNECIARLEPDTAKRVSASMQVRYPFAVPCALLLFLEGISSVFLMHQLSDYNSAKADFGTELAISTRTELDPGECIRLLNYSVWKIRF